VPSGRFALWDDNLTAATRRKYEIKTWLPSRITAIREHPCGTATMIIDVSAQEVTIVSVPHGDSEACLRRTGPSTWTLVDGFPVVLKLSQDRTNRARALVYEPAQKLLPIDK
jgi:hypothetical protein